MVMKRMIMMATSAMLMLPVVAQERYEMGNPNDEEHYGYLKEFGALKEYIDHEKYPNFKLGVGTTVSDYVNKGTVYRMTNANFTETVAGNAMKYASCVGNDGSMNFTNVKNYVRTATNAGLNVYGHTLAWHSQQNTTFLNGLIKDLPAPEIDGDVEVYSEIASKDFRTQQSVGWHSSESDYGYTLTYDATNGLHVHTTKVCTNSWDVQYVAMDNIPTEKGGKVLMTMTVRGSKSGNIHSKLGDWGGGPTAEIPFTTEWQDVEIEYGNTNAGSFLLLQNGDFVGDIYIKQIKFGTAVMGQTVVEDRRCLKVEADAKQNEVWDNQFWIVTDGFAAGSNYEFEAEVRADKAAKASTQIHNDPSNYVHWAAVGDIQFTTEWKTVKSSGRLDAAGKSIAFNLSELSDANNY